MKKLLIVLWLILLCLISCTKVQEPVNNDIESTLQWWGGNGSPVNEMESSR